MFARVHRRGGAFAILSLPADPESAAHCHATNLQMDSVDLTCCSDVPPGLTTTPRV